MSQLLGEDPDDGGRHHTDAMTAGTDRRLAFATVAAAAGAMGLSLVLAAGSGEVGGVAPGCGPGSGCDEVLRSPWSQVLGLRTAMVAVFTYALLIGATWPVSGLADWQLRSRPLVRQTLAAAVVGAVVWFVYLQFFEIGAVCMWCMSAHAAGLVVAGLTFWRDRRAGRIQPASVVLGLLGAVALAAAQLLNPPGATITQGPDEAVAAAALLASERSTSAAAGTQNQSENQSEKPYGNQSENQAEPGPSAAAASATRSLLRGLVTIDPASTPALGPADAAERVAVMLDYACPHCRGAHALLLERGVRVLVLPVPLHSDCNPSINPGGMPARFDDSCALAELGVAVFLAGGEAAYAAFDAAMFESPTPPSAPEAETLAARLAPGLDPSHRSRAAAVVAGNVAAWLRLGEAGVADRLPVLIDTASDRLAVGRLYGAEDLDTLLQP